ncbi:MAG: protein kinase [Burkholderiales bacterium]|nr:protein kinase [Burkholderiales bacterium]
MERVGKYQVKRELGRGASSIVYLAWDDFYNAELAVKVYRSRTASGLPELARQQFVREAAVAGKLAHPHIVAILDAVAEADAAYVAMEYVPGGSLNRHCTPKNLLPVGDVIQMVFKCCGALDYTYREGIIHRDIKPANILVAEGTDVKVADFGAAFVQNDASTQSGRMGSPAYVAPEQLREQPLTHQSDMFSLAVVLFELLCGRKPFSGTNAGEIMDRVLKLDAPPPSRLRDDLPPGLDDAVLRGLQKDPKDRYDTWADFALELARVGRLSLYSQDVPDSERYTLLRRAKLLETLTDAEIWEVAGVASWRRVPAQKALIVENEPGNSFFLLLSGEAKVTRQNRLLDVLRAGESFGEMGFTHGQGGLRQATVETATDSIVIELTPQALGSLPVACELHLTRAFLRSVADRLAFSNARLSQVGLGPQ